MTDDTDDLRRVHALLIAVDALESVDRDKPLTRVNRSLLALYENKDVSVRRFWCAELQLALAEMSAHANRLEAELILEERGGRPLDS